MLRHTIKQTVIAPLAKVYPVIADFKRYGELHPYMVAVKEIPGPDKRAKYYAVKESFLLYGFIPMRPAYDAMVKEIEHQKYVQYYSDVMTGVHLTIDIYFNDNTATGSVEIREEIILVAPPILGTLFLGILKKAHALFYEKLKKAIAA